MSIDTTTRGSGRDVADIGAAQQLAGKLMGIYSTGHGTGVDGALTWDEYMGEIDVRQGSAKTDWLPVAAWLAAQLVGERALTHADADHAMLQITRITRDFEERRRIRPLDSTAPQSAPEERAEQLLEDAGIEGARGDRIDQRSDSIRRLSDESRRDELLEELVREQRMANLIAAVALTEPSGRPLFQAYTSICETINDYTREHSSAEDAR